jgi:hypothetical protein
MPKKATTKKVVTKKATTTVASKKATKKTAVKPEVKTRKPAVTQEAYIDEPVKTRKTNSSGLSKPIRTGIKKYRAPHMKPAEAVASVEDPDEFSFNAIFVSDSKEYRFPCDAAMYRKIMGPEPKPGKKNRGLDMQVGIQFLVGVSKSTGYVVSIDILPESAYEHGIFPEYLEGVEEVEMVIDQKTGEVRVTKIPAKISTRVVESIIAQLDKVDLVEPGMILGGKYEVTNVSGNIVHVNPQLV